jgi:hypothetical protein
MMTVFHKIVITVALYCKCVVVGVETVGSKIKLRVGQQKVRAGFGSRPYDSDIWNKWQ